MQPLRVFVGFDPREAVAFHVCVHSIIRHASVPVSITPLALNTLAGFYEETHEGTNAFVHSRFLVPYLCGYKGQALFIDGDMVLMDDVAKLFQYLPNDCDVAVCKHDYKTKHPVKYWGQPNKDYPKKQWSSVVLWNCSYPANEALTPDYVAKASSQHLHRFEWIKDERRIGSIPLEWNWLCDEQPHNETAKLYHWTLGIPAISAYEDADHCQIWFDELHRTTNVYEPK